MRRLVLAVAASLIAINAQAQWLNYPTPGIPRLPDGKPNPSAPAPSLPDAKPDLDAIGLRDRGWLDTRKAHPHSDALHVIERFRRLDFGHLELVITIDDPKAYLKPWTARTVLPLLADTELLESFCDDHQLTLEHRSV